MAVRSIEEILDVVKKRIGEQSDDETISFLEDISDTLNDLESRASDVENWKTRYEENDKEWRKKYTERFFSTDTKPQGETEPNTEHENPTTFKELFTVKEN